STLPKASPDATSGVLENPDQICRLRMLLDALSAVVRPGRVSLRNLCPHHDSPYALHSAQNETTEHPLLQGSNHSDAHPVIPKTDHHCLQFLCTRFQL